MKTKYLFIGRFQPFHLGHLSVVSKCINKGIIIAIGSAQESHTLRNPFTAGERYEMIQDTLQDFGCEKVPIIPIPDVNRYGIWVSHIKDLCPKFDTVVTGNPTNAMLFKEAGYKVVAPASEFPISGTYVRQQMHTRDDWESLVHPAVSGYIKKIGGDKRVQSLTY